MNIQFQDNSLFFGNVNFFGTKSTQEKQQRQAERDHQIAFWENRKDSLKTMKCDCGSVNVMGEIGRKLALFQSYEEQIAAVKEEYNQSQMFHVLDEARERGEQIAEAAKQYAPKTEEVDSVKNYTDVLIFHTAICAGTSQIALMAEEKSPARISLRPVANAPEWRLIWQFRT